MTSFTYCVTDPEGMHARPAGQLVKKAGEYACQVTIEKGNQKVDGKRIFGIMSLGIKKGETITIRTEGEGEAEAAKGLEQFLQDNL